MATAYVAGPQTIGSTMAQARSGAPVAGLVVAVGRPAPARTAAAAIAITAAAVAVTALTGAGIPPAATVAAAGAGGRVVTMPGTAIAVILADTDRRLMPLARPLGGGECVPARISALCCARELGSALPGRPGKVWITHVILADRR